MCFGKQPGSVCCRCVNDGDEMLFHFVPSNFLLKVSLCIMSISCSTQIIFPCEFEFEDWFWFGSSFCWLFIQGGWLDGIGVWPIGIGEIPNYCGPLIKGNWEKVAGRRGTADDETLCKNSGVPTHSDRSRLGP